MNNDDLGPGGSTEEHPFNITNKSEVSVEYTVTIRNTTQNLPLTLQVKNNNNSWDDKTTEFKQGKPLFERTLAPNQTESTTLKFKIE